MSLLGTGRVMSQMTMQASSCPRRQLGERRRADGAGEGVGDGRFGIRQRRGGPDRQGADDAVVGQGHFQAGFAVVEGDTHRGSP